MCRELYNRACKRLEHYEKTGRGLTYAEQQNELPEMKKENPELTAVDGFYIPFRWNAR
jgi:hypothetical protein